MASSAIEMHEHKSQHPTSDEKEEKARPVESIVASSASSDADAAFSASPSSPAQLTLLLSRLQQYDLLNAAYRSYLSTHLESGQTWYLLSLSLLSSSRLDESYLAIRECLTRCPEDVPALMLAAQIALRLRTAKEAVEYSSRAMRGCKAQIAARAAAQAVEMQLAAADAGASPTTLSVLASGLEVTSDGAPKASSSFRPLIHYAPIQASLLQTCQLLFGVACSRYAYSVSTFTNRKSLQKRALHALENAYKQHSISVSGGASPSSSSGSLASHSPSALSSTSLPSPLVSNRRLLFALACLYADIREIPKAMALVRRVLELERTAVQHWNLLALLLSSQKKHRSAIQACEQGLQIVSATTIASSSASASKRRDAISPLLLTRARLHAHLGMYDEAIQGFSELVALLFPDAAVYTRPYASSAALGVSGGGSRSLHSTRPTFRPSRTRESTEKTTNARNDADLAKATVEEVRRRTAQVECLIALAHVYAAQASLFSTSSNSPTSTSGVISGGGGALGGGPSSSQPKDDSWLADAVDAVHYAREISPTSLLPDIHTALASLAAQGGSPALAVRHYESALVLDAAHTAALLGLARIETQRIGGNLVLAYGYIMSALQVDATSHHAWYEMGVILQAQGKSSAAAEHFITSLELEKTAPVASFETLPRLAV